MADEATAEAMVETQETAQIDPIEIIKQMFIHGSAPILLQPMISAETGQITGYEEQWNLCAEVAADASHSMSMNRAPDPKALGMALGKRGNMPFMPGGFEDEISKKLQQSESVCVEEEQKFLEFEEILTIPPGFDEPIIMPEFIDDPNSNAPPVFPPGISITNAAVDKLLALDLCAETSAAASMNKVHTAFKSVLINDLEEEVKPQEETKEEESKEPEAVVEEIDLSVQRESQNEFTHAKFLDEAKVAKRYEQIRPIMAKTYPFELDMFQKQAVVSMEANESVFVAAHTSAGKTVVAEYAIALSKIHKTRVIYTSPIKALSNQKFREFKQLFGEVGLITGDIQLNTDAFCLIMTTEVLRSMLYNGSEVIRELEWVIFDEVHYINDEERGYVWEESLIMLPSHVSIVMLSATVPNCIEFADWVGRIKQRQITVIQTVKRPVPLEHFIYTGHNGKTREELFLLMNKSGELLNYGHSQAVKAKAPMDRPVDPRYANPHQQQGGKNAQQSSKGKAAKYQTQQMLNTAKAIANGDKKKSAYAMDRSVYSNIVLFLKGKHMLPVVIFVFSRQRCDSNANMTQGSDLTTESEKFAIREFFAKCIDRLNGSDKILPQVVWMRELCERGFAVHHSGILPILKEVVELLFQRGLVKVLFATETFAMGVNMPARTVVFDAIEKFDGACKRPLNATEYTQMAGRAGRRGLDETGIVITLVKQTVPPITAFTQLLTGKAVSLDSRFRVTYAMILKLLRVEQFRIEDMLQRSYVERSSLRLAVSRKKQIVELKEKIDVFPEVDCEICNASGPGYKRESIDELFYDLTAYFDILPHMWESTMETLRAKTLNKGRIVLINYPPLGICGKLAVMLDTRKNEHQKIVFALLIAADESKRELENHQIKEFQALSDDDKKNQAKRMQLQFAATKGVMKVQDESRHERSYRVIYDFDPSFMVAVCKQSLKKAPNTDLIFDEDKKRINSFKPRDPDVSITRAIAELNGLSERCAATEAQVYQFGSDIKLKELNSYERMQQFIVIQDKLLKNKENYPCVQCPHFDNHFSIYLDRHELTNKLTLLTFQTSTNALLLGQEHLNRIKVLKSLDYIDKNDMIGLKGKIACEISHLEVLVTELIFENKFDGKSCAELAAMLCALTCQFGGKDGERELEFKHGINYILCEEIKEVANRIDFFQQTNEIHNSFVADELRFNLMDAVYEWASGVPFSDIMLTTSCQEGLIVRCIQRLDEVLKDVRNAARIIGNPLLYEQAEQTSMSIKRDIVFSASLYTD